MSDIPVMAPATTSKATGSVQGADEVSRIEVIAAADYARLATPEPTVLYVIRS